MNEKLILKVAAGILRFAYEKTDLTEDQRNELTNKYMELYNSIENQDERIALSFLCGAAACNALAETINLFADGIERGGAPCSEDTFD